MALCMAIILTQILCTAVLIRNLERTRKEAEEAQVSAMDVLEIQKQAASNSSITANSITIHPSAPAGSEHPSSGVIFTSQNGVVTVTTCNP